MTTVLVTRPEREAAWWVEALCASGWAARALPLIEIAPPTDTDALRRAQAAAPGFDAWMFVSAQAVRPFMTPALAQALPRCWAPGPGTAQALLAAGVEPGRIDQPAASAEQFDSEALWRVVGSQVHPGHRLLIVRGQSAQGHTGRDWLQAQCLAAGGDVSSCIAYRRLPPVWDAATRQRVTEWAGGDAIWLFSSTEGLQHLADLCPGQSWSRARALVTHPRIEMSARRMGFGEIITTRPALDDVVRALENHR